MSSDSAAGAAEETAPGIGADSGAGEAGREIPKWVRGILVFLLLYLFLTGIALLEAGIKGLGGDVQETLFEGVVNPLAALFVGVLATVLVQSSSVTTATIVGLVGAGVISPEQAVPMVMGANIGTTVTNTLASLANVRRPAEFRRAFAAATVHDFFNVCAVAILLPLEIAFGLITKSAEWLTELLFGSGGSDFKSPLKEAVKAPANFTKDILSDVGFDSTWLGIALIVVGLVAIYVALALITTNMRALVAERAEATLNRLLSQGGGVIAMVVGLVFTLAVQSSSVTTSVMIPLAAAGIITLENIYPVTLGANVGTTVTALLAALATGSVPALTVALAHAIFNIYGILLFYPIQIMRRIPLRLARSLADLAVRSKTLALGYVGVTFIVLPLVGILILR